MSICIAGVNRRAGSVGWLRYCLGVQFAFYNDKVLLLDIPCSHGKDQDLKSFGTPTDLIVDWI